MWRELKVESIPTGPKSICLIQLPLWGCIPPTMGDLRWHHCACSSSQRRAHHHLIEEQWGHKDGSKLASPQRSPEPVCQVEGDPGLEASRARPQMPPWL